MTWCMVRLSQCMTGRSSWPIPSRISSPCHGRSSCWNTIVTMPVPWISWSRASLVGILRRGLQGLQLWSCFYSRKLFRANLCFQADALVQIQVARRFGIQEDIFIKFICYLKCAKNKVQCWKLNYSGANFSDRVEVEMAFSTKRLFLCQKKYVEKLPFCANFESNPVRFQTPHFSCVSNRKSWATSQVCYYFYIRFPKMFVDWQSIGKLSVSRGNKRHTKTKAIYLPNQTEEICWVTKEVTLGLRVKKVRNKHQHHTFDLGG